MSQKILLVDDEEDILEFLEYNLLGEGFEVVKASNGREALDNLKVEPDLIILDIMMPEMDGYEVCQKIRMNPAFKRTPVIFLSAKSSEVDEIKGLELGADDFMKKPISTKKLIARVKSNLRKISDVPESDSEDQIAFGPIEIDRVRYTIKIEGEKVVFPKKEFEILYYLVSRPEKVFSRHKILSDIWGDDVFVVDRTVDVHIRKIREKLGKYASMIETIKGVGYSIKKVD